MSITLVNAWTISSPELSESCLVRGFSLTKLVEHLYGGQMGSAADQIHQICGSRSPIPVSKPFAQIFLYSGSLQLRIFFHTL